jgi:gluconate 2-dehydrogenase gamma chain
MLSPPAYGGNPNGIGWQWLNHQPGFPLPEKGGRYYEIPSRFTIPVVQLDQTKATTLVPKKAIEDTRKS